MGAKRVIRVALLICDTPRPEVIAEHGTYLDIFRKWLTESLASYPDDSVSAETELIVDGYDVVDKQEYPSPERLVAAAPDGYDCIMMTGSKHTAFDTTDPFIPPLINFVRDVATSDQTQHIKLVGICFGHQIIALALGGECVSGKQGWEVGVYGCELTPEGRYWWTGDVEGQGGGDKVYLEQMHRDVVPSVPAGCHLLLKTQKCPVHSMVRYHPASTPTKPLAQILTVQGHPEFTPPIVSKLIDARSAAGIFDEEATAEARRRFGGKDGSGGEGYGRVGWAVWRVLLQEIPIQT
ncbi:hypothetical protein IAR55_004569 [Kwoniella newhampshirensis]|uniref:Glutamine amidotransferase domain-containing protein n=1 Tax=Kwoniella newhampshirensis TaxID=1651941 RepID=A0AAW0YVJ5_9TREE